MVESRFRLQVFMVVFLSILFVGTLGLMFIEGLSPWDAFYFTIVTIATVGYGDISPVTPAGKILAVIIIIAGVGTFLGVVANASEMLLNRREQRIRRQKLNMVIGLFFSEIGTRLLSCFSEFDPQLESIRKDLIVTTEWSDSEFSSVMNRLRNYGYAIDIHRGSLMELRVFLKEKGDFLIRLLENPLLLEHEHFTDLLMALFHLREEMLSRNDLKQLPDSDYAHLSVDIKRVYDLLVHHWIEYMKYLKADYPYLFSHAMRTNPFDPSASPIVK